MEDKQTAIAVKVLYWALPIPENQIVPLNGIAEFEDELSRDYVAVVHGRQGDCGGLYDLTIDVIANIKLSDVAKFIAEGVAFDIMKASAGALFLKPLLSAVKRLRERNKHEAVSIDELRIVFKDCEVNIDSIIPNGIEDNYETILAMLSRHYHHLRLDSGEYPFELHLPLLEDTEAGRISRFRQLLDVDETIVNRSSEDYFKYWGAYYDLARCSKVYDVTRGLLLKDDYLTRARYWTEWESRQQ